MAIFARMVLAVLAASATAAAVESAPSTQSDSNHSHQKKKPDRDKKSEDRLRGTSSDHGRFDCRAAVHKQAKDRFHTTHIKFLRTGKVDGAVIGDIHRFEGVLEIEDGEHRGERYPFSCSVESSSGHTRSASIGSRDPYPVTKDW
ncbi:MAG: hypothetical protein JOZ62_20620 [Acidobacteriaceae bacterium]|nr:hypothetical protein [Acidobacteriaceae bacterium]